jgi:hypothetical protein
VIANCCLQLKDAVKARSACSQFPPALPNTSFLIHLCACPASFVGAAVKVHITVAVCHRFAAQLQIRAVMFESLMQFFMYLINCTQKWAVIFTWVQDGPIS